MPSFAICRMFPCARLVLFGTGLLVPLDAISIPSVSKMSHGLQGDQQFDTGVVVMSGGPQERASLKASQGASAIDEDSSPRHRQSHSHNHHHHAHHKHASEVHDSSSPTRESQKTSASNSGRQTPGRYCSKSTISAEKLGLISTPAFMEAQVSGYCYYLSKQGQSCTDACWEISGMRCDAMGTEFAANSVDQCRQVVESFGFTANTGNESQNDRAGCVFSDVGFMSQVEVMKEDNLYPLCSEEHNITSNHRICACTPIFGQKEQFTESEGDCTPGAASAYKKSAMKHKGECEDECARDSTCTAFSYVHPWDSHKRTCLFYSGTAAGDGSNKHIRCSVKEEYMATLGVCTKAGGEQTELSSANYDSVASCKQACDDRADCHAYGVDTEFHAGGVCKLYGAGHTGDGTVGKRCETKATGGIDA